jgi:multiple sugar transport system permease protein
VPAVCQDWIRLTDALSPRYRSRRRRGLRRARAWPFLLPIVVWILLMFGYPAYDTVRMAFSYVNANDFVGGDWKWAGFQNFESLPYVEGFDLMLRNTGLFIACSVGPQFFIGGLLALALRENSRPRRWARSLVLLPWLFPVVATATTFMWLSAAPTGFFDLVLKNLGFKPPYLLDTGNDALVVVILANIWIGVPFFYLVIQSGLQTIAPVLHEAALVDGCSWWKELTRITIPLLRVTLLTVLMLGVAGTMNVFSLVWVMTMGGPADATMLPGPLAYNQAFVDFNYGQGAAIILAVVVVLLCVGGVFLVATRSRLGAPRRAKHSRAPGLPSEQALAGAPRTI